MEEARSSLLLPDLQATRALGGRLAGLLRPGSLVLLEGDLGAGKSELARATIRAVAGTDIVVPSPTFTLVQSYLLPTLEVSHADLYRLDDPGEVAELGLDELWRRGALLVEWPGRAPAAWPAEQLTIALAAAGPASADARSAVLRGTGRWAAAVPELVAAGRFSR